MTTNTTTPKKIEEQRFEFVLYINGHIICQRYFNIPDYNEDSIKSLEMKELIDSISGINNGQWGDQGIIPKHLKKKTIDYLWDNYNPYSTQQDETYKSNSDKIDDFQFEIKVDKATVIKTQFSGNYFPPKVRYAVDIKVIIPSIIAQIRQFMSQKNYIILEANPVL